MNLRPTSLTDIVGQKNIKECLNIILKAYARKTMPHMLWTGPPGTGKTTFATVIANEHKSKLYMTNGGNIGKVSDILPYLMRLKETDILFVDEVHRMDVRVQESLFTVMEDFRFDVTKTATSLKLAPFTMIGATTEAGLLLKPLYDRFKNCFQLDEYSNEEITELIKINAKKLHVAISERAAGGLAKRARWTPRIANSLLEWCCAYVKAMSLPGINFDVVNKAMKARMIDENGLDRDDRLYLSILKRAGKPMGVNTLVSATGLSRNTVEDRIEPYLIKCGMIEKSTKGRCLL